MLSVNEPAGIADRFLRPVARIVLNSSPGKAFVSRWPLPWLFKRPVADYGFVATLFKHCQLGRLEGDILELGAWLGFGTVELAKLAAPFRKMVHTADRFPTDFRKPESVTADGARRYLKVYAGMTQRQVFDLNVRKWSNIVVHAQDIMDLTFVLSQRFVCSVIDASKDADDNRYYLRFTWSHTVPGGLIFIDDYRNPDYPGVGEAVDEWISANQHEIRAVHVKRERRIVAIEKGRLSEDDSRVS